MADQAKDPVVLPCIHMNGTSAESLTDALEDAYLALSDALDKMRQIAPNGRDYYPEPGKMDKAVEQHRKRCQAIHDVMQSIQEEVEGINAIVAGRKA